MSPKEELNFLALNFGEFGNSNSGHSMWMNCRILIAPQIQLVQSKFFIYLFLNPTMTLGVLSHSSALSTWDSLKVLDLRDIPWLEVNLSSFYPLRIQSFSIRKCPQILH